MAGHSKWANIKRTKGANDAKRSAIFNRISKEITVAARLGESGDINFNPMLRVSVDKAKAANMPNEKIEKAINKGVGITDGDESLIENTYEIYAPYGVAMLVDCETDNANRTLTDIKTYVSKNGGKLSSEGSISWQFNEIGYIEVSIITATDPEEMALELLDLEGINDFKVIMSDEFTGLALYTAKESLKNLSDIIKSKYQGTLELKTTKLIKHSNTPATVDSVQLKEVEEFIEGLEEIPEITEIWTNLA